jgi:hypothetical protein
MTEAFVAFIIGACMGLSVVAVFAIAATFFFPVSRPIRVLSKKKHLRLLQGGKRK